MPYLRNLKITTRPSRAPAQSPPPARPRELRVDVLQVLLHRARGDEELAAGFLVGGAGRDEAENFDLALAQAFRSRGTGREAGSGGERGEDELCEVFAGERGGGALDERLDGGAFIDEEPDRAGGSGQLEGALHRLRGGVEAAASRFEERAHDERFDLREEALGPHGVPQDLVEERLAVVEAAVLDHHPRGDEERRVAVEAGDAARLPIAQLLDDLPAAQPRLDGGEIGPVAFRLPAAEQDDVHERGGVGGPDRVRARVADRADGVARGMHRGVPVAGGERDARQRPRGLEEPEHHAAAPCSTARSAYPRAASRSFHEQCTVASTTSGSASSGRPSLSGAVTSIQSNISFAIATARSGLPRHHSANAVNICASTAGMICCGTACRSCTRLNQKISDSTSGAASRSFASPSARCPSAFSSAPRRPRTGPSRPAKPGSFTSSDARTVHSYARGSCQSPMSAMPWRSSNSASLSMRAFGSRSNQRTTDPVSPPNIRTRLCVETMATACSTSFAASACSNADCGIPFASYHADARRWISAISSAVRPRAS